MYPFQSKRNLFVKPYRYSKRGFCFDEFEMRENLEMGGMLENFVFG